MKRKAKKRPIAKRGSPPKRGTLVPIADSELPGEDQVSSQKAILTGGDVDADWPRAESSGEEAVGGTVATPDQDGVDEIGRAVGLGQPPDAEVRTSGEILHERDRRRWDLESNARDDRKP
jgi:Family of unknown function (DUF6335)